MPVRPDHPDRVIALLLNLDGVNLRVHVLGNNFRLACILIDTVCAFALGSEDNRVYFFLLLFLLHDHQPLPRIVECSHLNFWLEQLLMNC